MLTQRPGFHSGYSYWPTVKLHWKQFQVLESFKTKKFALYSLFWWLEFIRSIPGYAELKMALLPNCSCATEKLIFLWDFNTYLPLTKRVPSFALVSIITLHNMCHVPVSVQCISGLNHLAHPLLHDRSAWVHVKTSGVPIIVWVVSDETMWSLISSQTSRSTSATQDEVSGVVSRPTTHLDMAEKFSYNLEYWSICGISVCTAPLSLVKLATSNKNTSSMQDAGRWSSGKFV